MAKSFIFLILAFLLLSTAQSRPLSTNIGQQADDLQIPFSSPESSFNDDDCRSLDGEECLLRSLAAHTDHIYTEENIAPPPP